MKMFSLCENSLLEMWNPQFISLSLSLSLSAPFGCRETAGNFRYKVKSLFVSNLKILGLKKKKCKKPQEIILAWNVW